MERKADIQYNEREKKDCSNVGADFVDSVETESGEWEMSLNLGYRKLETMFSPKQPKL